MALSQAVSHMNNHDIPPVGKESRTRHSPIDCERSPRHSVWRYRDLDQIKPILPCDAGFWNISLVVGIDVVATPARSIAGRVSITSRGRLSFVVGSERWWAKIGTCCVGD